MSRHTRYELRRKCAKCNITATEDTNLSFHRFPLPGRHTIIKARVWAEYCYPTREWSTEKSLRDLHSQHKMLCSKHFDDSSFTSSARTRLNNYAIPIGAQDLLIKFRQEQCATASGSEQDTNISAEKPQVENTDICDDDDDADDVSDTLVESNVCRVCLALDVKMYDLKDIELREMFQNITGITVTESNHSTLERLCWECAGRLKAAAAFRNQALHSDALLQGLASTGEQIRKNDITLIKENKDYLKSVGSLSAVIFHIVDIDPENDSVPPISENIDTEMVQKIVRNDSIKLKKESIIDEDNDQMDVEDESVIAAAITIDTEYDQFDHICPNTGEERSNSFIKTNPVFANNVPFREDKINSASSRPLPSCSPVEPKNSILGCLLKTPSGFEDRINKHVIKITKRDLIPKIVFKNSNEVISVLKGDAKLKNVNVKIGGISKKTSNLKLVKKTQVKANTLINEESLRLEDFEF